MFFLVWQIVSVSVSETNPNKKSDTETSNACLKHSWRIFQMSIEVGFCWVTINYTKISPRAWRSSVASAAMSGIVCLCLCICTMARFLPWSMAFLNPELHLQLCGARLHITVLSSWTKWNNEMKREKENRGMKLFYSQDIYLYNCTGGNFQAG